MTAFGLTGRKLRLFRTHGTGYIVMEYVEGQTLSKRLKERGVVSEGQLRQILLPLLEGLEEVHRSGLIHRDIKPEKHHHARIGRFPGVAGLWCGASDGDGEESPGDGGSDAALCAD